MEDDIKFCTQMKDNINFSRKWKTTSILRGGHGKHFPKKESILGGGQFLNLKKQDLSFSGSRVESHFLAGIQPFPHLGVGGQFFVAKGHGIEGPHLKIFWQLP
jgi:hypothetical protein